MVARERGINSGSRTKRIPSPEAKGLREKGNVRTTLSAKYRYRFLSSGILMLSKIDFYLYCITCDGGVQPRQPKPTGSA